MKAPPLHQACPYFTMFPLDFPLAHLRRLPKGAWVLDPFAGRGTTLWAARLLGINAVGMEVSPVAYHQARALLATSSQEEVLELAESLLQGQAGEVPQGEFWELAYHPETLAEILALRQGLLETSRPEADLLRLFVMGRLHGPLRENPQYLSNQMPRTYAPKPAYAVRFWRSRNLHPPRVRLKELVQRAVKRYLAGALPSPIEGGVVLGDAREVDFHNLGGPYDLVLTSPPYPGMRTYVPDQWLRGWFLGGPPYPLYRYRGQLAYTSVEHYASELRRVWLKAAEASKPGARLIVRLGSLKRGVHPVEVFRLSLLDTPWHLLSASPVEGKRRQAVQFMKPSPEEREGGEAPSGTALPEREWDLEAVLG